MLVCIELAGAIIHSARVIIAKHLFAGIVFEKGILLSFRKRLVSISDGAEQWDTTSAQVRLGCLASRTLQCGWILTLELACRAGATDLHYEETGSPEIELSPVLVNAPVDDLPWRYAQDNRVEVLTLCAENITRAVSKAATRSRLYLPVDFQGAGTRPIQYILFDEAIALNSPNPTQRTPLANGRFGEGWILYTNALSRPSGISAANLFGVTDWPELNTRFATYYFDNSRPVGPEWLRAGLLGELGAIHGLASFDKLLRLAKLDAFAWNQIDKVKAMLTAEEEGFGIYPLLELFESPPPENSDLRQRWELQAALFCRWQIYSQEGQRNGGNGFWNWARMARKGPVDEAAFKRCIGMDYTTAEKRMLKYLDRVLGVPQDVPIRLYPLEDELKLRPATEQEIARLLGGFYWQEAKRLMNEGEWEQAVKYEAAARRTYTRGLKRTGGHAALHAGLGLMEHEAGCPDEARAHLEKAFAGKGADAKALLALSSLRLEEVKAASGSGGKLNAEQISFVLTPAFAARDETPVSVEIYRLIGEVWALSAFIPEAKYLNVLLEGVANYPHDLHLAHQVAELHARFGHHEIARAVAQRAARLAGRSKYRERFDALMAGVGQP